MVTVGKLGLDKTAKSHYNNGMVKITIRIPDEEDALHKALVKSAQNNRRSLNGEILRALDYYIKNAPEAQYEVKPVEKEVTKKKSKSP